MTDVNREKLELIISNHPIRQILVDIESYEREMKDLERLIQQQTTQFIDKSEVTLLWMETVTRKDLFKQLTLLSYETMLELKMEEKIILQKFFYEMNGYQWKDTFGWIGQTANVARLAIEPFDSSTSLFEGIRLSRVTESSNSQSECYLKELSLPGYGCEGHLDTSFDDLLKKCHFLNLNWNIISSNISNFHFSSCRSLKVLQLLGNELVGSLDVNSFQFVNQLRVLDLSFNKLSGELPSQLFNSLLNLERLNLSNNMFEGELPISLKKLTKLQELKLFKNQFSGEIQEEIFMHLKDLTHLNLSNNRFTKGLQALCHNTHLDTLQLQFNRFQERIHSNIQNLKKLEICYLHSNQFYGLLPNDLCELKKLRMLNLSNNQFRGCLPENIGKLVNLEVLLLAGNNLIGPVPLSFGQLENLRDLTLFKSYPSELCSPKRAFSRFAFNRIYLEGPKQGINSIHWNFKEVYGRERTSADDESVTIFSGQL